MCFRILWTQFLKNCWNPAGIDEVRQVLEKLLKSVCTAPTWKYIEVKLVLKDLIRLEDLIESSFHWLPGVWYPREIDSAQYETPGRLTLRSMIPRGDWLCAVCNPGEIDSAQYHTPGWFIKIRISRRKRNQNRKYFNPLVSGPGRFELWKKLGGPKSRWTVP